MTQPIPLAADLAGDAGDMFPSPPRSIFSFYAFPGKLVSEILYPPFKCVFKVELRGDTLEQGTVQNPNILDGFVVSSVYNENKRNKMAVKIRESRETNLVYVM